MNILSSCFVRLFGDPNEKTVKRLRPILEKVNSFESKMKKLSPEELKAQTEKLKKELAEGKTLDDILPRAFAVVREASDRVLGERHFDEQILGGIVLHQGKIAEMKTGEGKTLTATLPVYLNALTGKGVHVITVNDYLAKRDTNWMGAVFNFLGVSTACIQHDKSFIFEPKIKPDKNEVSIEYANLKEVSRKEAYSADITYGTNNEFGFDYLRDNMVQNLTEMVQIRNPEEADRIESHLNYAIVDEVDSILIDEARTPLIISAPDEDSNRLYRQFAQIVPSLEENRHYNIDEKMKAVTLTEEGIEKIEKILNIKNLYREGGVAFVHHLQQALRAEVIFKKDRDYVVREGQVIIVDEFTGRMMPGRRFSEGLHQALEAKEKVEIQKESKTLATITFQNYFRMYKKIAGMTGTAMSSAEELNKVYKLEVVSIPTHRKMIRQDLPDRVYKNEKGKFKAITAEIKERNLKGQPILVGTIAIEKSELLSKYFEIEGIKHEILNAKNHEREAQIIAHAGRKGAVTIATNMAGRGTDIKLDEKAKKLGGLHILGTERHEARRIDDQLRGRSGRQGDPGSSQFFVSMEDELMRRFGSDRVKNMMDTLGIPDDEPIENKMISRSIEKAQAKIEGYNLDIRKHVLEYDDVMNRQREIIYQKRRDLLIKKDDFQQELLRSGKNIAQRLVEFHLNAPGENWNIQEIGENIRAIFGFSAEEQDSLIKHLDKIREDESLTEKERKEKIVRHINKNIEKAYAEREEVLPKEHLSRIGKIIFLRTIDLLWMSHLDNMQYLREGIGLRGYGQRDPLVEYKQESFRMFEQLLNSIEEEATSSFFKLEFKQQSVTPIREEKSETEKALARAEYSKPEEPSGFSGGEEKSKTGQQIKSFPKVGRNDPCPCGSGKKYKKCCGKK